MRNNWTQEEDNLLKQHYLKDKLSQNLVSLLKNRNYNAIKARATFLGIRKYKIYTKNDNFFEIPNLINSYWAGFWVTDGHIAPRRETIRKDGSKEIDDYRFDMGLCTKDKSHLQKFLNDCNSNNKITDAINRQCIKTERNKNIIPKDYYVSYICINKSAKWFEDVNKNWNIPAGNKTFKVIPPNLNIIKDTKCLLAYLKGALDGDGTIYLCKAKHKIVKERLSITFLGTSEFLHWIKYFLSNFINSRTEVMLERKNSKIYRYGITGLDACIIYDLLNNLNCPKLDRKWNNPSVLQHIEEQKTKYPHLFPKPPQPV